MKLLPTNTAFFDEFDQHTALIVKAAEALSAMSRGEGGAASDLAGHIKDLEEQGDKIVHHVVTELRKTFITPLDRDDSHRLISSLDDVLDQIEAAAYRLVLYRLPMPERHITALVDTVARSAVVVRDAVANLRDKTRYDKALELCVEINKLENDSDGLLRTALGELFGDGADAIAIIKRKEVLETLEETTDRCEDVADSIENLLLDS
jgi:predicted phosphate transport protein (TIGR00153 family)